MKPEAKTVCPTCERAGRDHDDIKAKCLDSIFWTGYYLYGFEDLDPVLHKGLCIWYDARVAEGWQKILVMVPRVHFKTSLLTQARHGREMIRDTDFRSLLVMHNEAKAIEKLSVTTDAFTGPRMEHFFPDCVPSRSGGDIISATKLQIPRITLASEPTITAMGIKGGNVGGHYWDISMDDPVDGRAEDFSIQMDHAIRFMKRVNPLWEDPATGRLTVIGTYWEGGLYESLEERPDFAKLILGAEVDERWHAFLDEVGMGDKIKDYPIGTHERPNPIFKRRGRRGHTTETLIAARYEMDDEYVPQYLNMRRSDTQKRFEPEWFPTYTPIYNSHDELESIRFGEAAESLTLPLKSAKITTGFDPAGAGKLAADRRKSDPWALSTTAWWPSHEIGALIEHETGRCLPDEQYDRAVAMVSRWGSTTIYPEFTGTRNDVDIVLENKLREAGVRGCTVEGFYPGKLNKYQRLVRHIRPIVKKKRFWVLAGEHDEVVREATGLKVKDGNILGKSPNILDSLVPQMKHWRIRYRGSPEDGDPTVKEERYNFDWGGDYVDRAVNYGMECET
jgi:hypothetical protein